jgi:VanZ family protein
MRWVVWFLYVLVMSAILVTPQPAQMAQAVIASDDTRFTVSKAFHLLAYAGLAVLSGWLRVPENKRQLLLLVLTLHACGTEFLQHFVPSRTSSWHDVALDFVGLYFGLLLSWKWWIGR